MSTNPDIKRALGAVTCEPTEDSIKLFANDVDITDELGGGGGESGYTVEETKQTIIAEQTVQTISQGGWYNGALSGDLSGVSDGTKCFVTYNGTEYEVDVTEDAAHGLLVLGELSGESPVFTNYPFTIVFVAAAGQSVLLAQTESPTIKAEAVIKTVTPSDNFKAAVAASGGDYLTKISTDFVVENAATLSSNVMDNDGVQHYIRWTASDNPAWDNLYKSTVDTSVGTQGHDGLTEIKMGDVSYSIDNNGYIVSDGVPTNAQVSVSKSGTKRYISIYENITDDPVFLPQIGTTLVLQSLVYQKLSVDPNFAKAVNLVMGY